MLTETYNLYSLLLAGATLLATGAGLYGVFFQIRKIREGAWTSMHSKLCDQSFELLRFLSETPGTRPYFYDNRSLSPTDPDRIQVLYQAEALANFLEHLILQKTQLPAAQWAVWERFLYGTFNSSGVVCRFIAEHADWYSLDLVAVARACERAARERAAAGLEAVEAVSAPTATG